MKKNIKPIAITALVCLSLGVLAGMLISSGQVYHYQTIPSPVGSERGFGHLTGFFKRDSKWQGGYTKTDASGTPEHRVFYNQAGEKDGLSVSHYPGGNVSSISHYCNGELHGQYIQFSQSGNIDQLGYYEGGELVKGSVFSDKAPWSGKNEIWENLREKT